MKNIMKTISLAVGCLFAGAALQSCALDEPFGQDGEGTLQMKLVINSDVTRAESDVDALSSNCVVYISSAKGLIHKYQGLQNLPESVRLKSGHYVAEAWTGDSVTASFDKKFFRGYQPFDITTGMTPVVINCKIANVVVSVNPATVDKSMMQDFNIKVENTRGSLDFTADNYEYAKGYFMMPNQDTSIKVTVTGKNAEGVSFSKEQVIENVERAHEYVLNLAYNPSYEEEGGSFVTITVDDSEVLVEGEVEIYSRPRVSGVEFDVDKQIVGNAGAFKQKILRVKGFGGFKSLLISSDDYAAFKLPEAKIDLKQCTEEVATAIKTAGLTWDESFNEEKNLATSFITFTPELLNALPERDQEYVLTLEVTDIYGKTFTQPVRFAVGEGAIVIEDPITLNVLDQSKDLLAVRTNRATVSGTLVDPEALNPGVRYRVAGTSDWTFAALDASTVKAVSKRRGMSAARILRAPGKGFTMTLTGLQPGTRYEYQAVAGEFASESQFFTTEGKFLIPNAGMEEWSNYSDNSKVILPGAGGERTFWDTGNHGSATMSVNLTQSSSDMVHGGATSARLRSQFVGLGGFAGKFAAGNLFAGTYLETQGTDGRLEFGREYDGSHPDKLRVYCNYRPQAADKNGSKNGKLSLGEIDKGQIYIALSTAKVEVRTKKSNQKLFNPEDPEIVAYGEVTFDGNYGPDGALEALDIPFNYYQKASSTKPLYLIIVCTASKFGDYFDGGEGSTMYLDDFELVYE